VYSDVQPPRSKDRLDLFPEVATPGQSVSATLSSACEFPERVDPDLTVTRASDGAPVFGPAPMGHAAQHVEVLTFPAPMSPDRYLVRLDYEPCGADVPDPKELTVR
jgi:hypothetical protein